MHAYIKSSGFIGGKGPRPLKKLSFCQTMVMLDYMCVQSFMITHMQCFMLIVVYKVICSHCLRLVAIGYMITHTQCFMLTVKYKVIYVVIA